MTAVHHSHQRTPSAGHKFVLRPTGSRPVITKNYSSGKLSSGSASKTNVHNSSKSKSTDSDNFVDDFDMAMSFHQYCTTCEKQIAVPNNAVLYCSESCRRRDGSFVLAPPSPPLLSEYEAFTKRPALSRRKLTHALSAPAVPAVQHQGNADMDPTEWKPDGSHALLGSDGGVVSSNSRTAEPPRRPSEAFLYLSQFHKSSDSLTSSSSRRSKKSEEKKAGRGGAAAATVPAGKGGFYLTPAGSNESSAAGSPMESISITTTRTAPSVSSSESDPEHGDEDDSMAFSKKKLGAREEVSGSLGLLLATSRDGS